MTDHLSAMLGGVEMCAGCGRNITGDSDTVEYGGEVYCGDCAKGLEDEND